MKHILITREDAKNAKTFLDNNSCLIATALKRKFPKSKVTVYGWSLDVDGKRYAITNFNSPKTGFYDLGNTLEERLTKFKPFIVKVKEYV